MATKRSGEQQGSVNPILSRQKKESQAKPELHANLEGFRAVRREREALEPKAKR